MKRNKTCKEHAGTSKRKCKDPMAGKGPGLRNRKKRQKYEE